MLQWYVLEACEKLALSDGRDLLRSTLAAVFKAESGSASKKGGGPPVPRVHSGYSKGRHTRTVLTAVGLVTLERIYFLCPVCKQGDFGADRILGVEGYVTRGACRMACLLGVQQSFTRAQRVAEVAGWNLDDNTIRRLCHATAAAASDTREQRATAQAFAQAGGIWSCRSTRVRSTRWGAGATSNWLCSTADHVATQRRLSNGTNATCRADSGSVVAAVEEASQSASAAREADRLELTTPEELSVLGDGAEWVWNLSARHFAGAEELLDIWHGAEYLADGAKAVCGQGSEAAKEQTEKGKQRLLGDGYCGVVEWIGELTAAGMVGGDGAALGGVLNYFAGHQCRLNYALRLRRGQSIGSGLVEGSIKQLVNKRVKQTGARWKVEHVGPFVELGALAAGPEWQAFWEIN